MAEYKIVYPFEVFEQVCNGKRVGMVDRLRGDVVDVNDLTVDELAEVLNTHKKEPTRFEFWTVNEERVKENEHS